MKIILDRNKCIGCGSCAAICPKFFEMAQDGKSHLINSQPAQSVGGPVRPSGEKDAQGIESFEVENADCAKDAADVCPVQAISVEA